MNLVKHSILFETKEVSSDGLAVSFAEIIISRPRIPGRKKLITARCEVNPNLFMKQLKYEKVQIRNKNKIG